MSMRPFTRLEDEPNSVAIWGIYFVLDPKPPFRSDAVSCFRNAEFEKLKGRSGKESLKTRPLFVAFLFRTAKDFHVRIFVDIFLNAT